MQVGSWRQGDQVGGYCHSQVRLGAKDCVSQGRGGGVEISEWEEQLEGEASGSGQEGGCERQRHIL